MLRSIVKNLMGRYFSLRGGIKASKNLYVGCGCKIVNRGEFTCGENVTIRPHCNLFIGKEGLLKLENGADIGNHSTISVYNQIVIGQDVLVSPNCYIADHNHQYEDPTIPIIKQGVRAEQGASVVIDSGSWLGKNVCVVGNLRIGKNCVIGANSVVTKDIPDHSIAAGVPAKIIKRYDFEQHKWVRV